MKRTAAATLLASGVLCASPAQTATILNSPIEVSNGSLAPCIVIGDVNGDTIPDFAASAPGSGSGQDHIAVFSGADGAVLYRCSPDSGYFGLGESLQPLGNYGGDAAPDFASGADFGGNGGAVFVFDGSNGTILHRIDAPSGESTGGFGSELFMADVTGTSAPDFLVGSSTGGSNGGRIHIYDGATRTSAAVIEPPVSQAGQRFTVTSLIPDLTGDGVPEIGAAAPFQDVASNDSAGAAYIFNGATRALYRTITLSTPHPIDQLTGPFPLGDLNGDAKSEYACAYGGNDSIIFPTPGAVDAALAIFSGIDGSLLDTIPTPSTSVTDFGRYVAGIDDITGDSANEIVIGTYWNAIASNSTGRVYIYNGATRALVDSFSTPLAGIGGGFGQGLSLVGDADGDGKQDLAIPAPYEGSNGLIHIFTHKGRPGFTSATFNAGENRIGGTPAVKTLKVHNYGLSSVVIDSLSIGGTDAADFSISTNPFPANLSAAANATVGLTSSATVPGYKDATLTADAANGTQASIALTQEAYLRPSGPDTQLAYIAAHDRVLVIDTLTGDRDILSGAGVGSGTIFVNGFDGSRVTDVLVENASNLIVTAGWRYYRVDRNDGSRTLLNSSPVADGFASTSDSIASIEWESPGVIVALVGFSVPRLIRLTLSSMTATPISHSSLGTGPTFSTYAADILVEDAGTILLNDFTARDILRIDAGTGNRTVLNAADLPYCISMAMLSGDEVALGEFSPGIRFRRYDLAADSLTTIATPAYSFSATINAMDVYDDGTIVALDSSTSSLVRVNSTTGDVTVVATPSTYGLGPTLPAGFYSDPAGLRLVNSAATASGARSWALYR